VTARLAGYTDRVRVEPIPVELEMRLPGTPQAPTLARRAVSILRDRVPEQTLQCALLLTSELVTNAVRHGGTPRERVGLGIRLGRQLRVEVTDAGAGFRWGRLGATDPMRGDGGLGFLLLAELATSWGVETGPPTRVWFELDPHGPFGAPGARVSTPTNRHLGGRMDEKRDETKGRMKEAAGAITGDDELKREGKMDRAGASVKEKVNDAVDRTKDALTRDR
jgi:uncharacterized protein YjbJ (UPF0337 family)/anti-sigma regulatory factor (Ser/Thr protein kinase)